jgi:hypothetical protein
VVVNDQPAGSLTGLVYNATINRGIQAPGWRKDVAFDASLMKAGANTLKLTIPAGGLTSGIIYDHLSLEVESSNPGGLHLHQIAVIWTRQSWLQLRRWGHWEQSDTRSSRLPRVCILTAYHRSRSTMATCAAAGQSTCLLARALRQTGTSAQLVGMIKAKAR